MVLCIHTDADEPTDSNAFSYKINPAFTAINNIIDGRLCKNLVAIVPVHMTEAWMLADSELLKAEIGTNKSDNELGLIRSPEEYNNPKEIIEIAIRLARHGLPKRRRGDFGISRIYSPIGQKVKLNKLEGLPSYRKFKAAIRAAYRRMNYLI